MEAIYGEKEARELLGCPGNLAILHLNANAQAARQWASEAIGQDEQLQANRGLSRISKDKEQDNQTTKSLNTSYTTKPLYLPIEFYLLGRAGSEEGLQGIFVVDDHLHKAQDKWNPEEKVTIPNHELFGEASKDYPDRLCPEVEKSENLVYRDKDDTDVEDWQKEDSQRMPDIALAFLVKRTDSKGVNPLDRVGSTPD